MAKLSYKARKRWAIVILILALPAYIVTAVTIITMIGRPSIWMELSIYIGLGVLWVFPLKRIFMGIGQADPDAPPED